MKLVQASRRAASETIRILWLEDNPDEIALGLQTLRNAGLKVRCEAVESPDEFKQRLESRKFDIVLADYQLPSWSGIEALELLRKTSSEIPFILVTGTLPEAVAVRCIEQGITDYVLKETIVRLPVSIRLALVNKALREKTARAEKALRQAGRKSREQLRWLAAHAEAVREEERKRIAREVYDVFGQALTGLKMEMAWVVSRFAKKDAKLSQRARTMSRLIDSTVQTVRKIATELRPGILDQLGLFAAIEWQAEQFQKRTGITCHCSIECPDRKLHNTASSALFRILEEILTNVARHAKAKQVSVTVRDGRGRLVLEVRDNGAGIRPSDVTNPKSLGILSMRERVHIFGGEVTIRGWPGRGTSVVVKIPVDT